MTTPTVWNELDARLREIARLKSIGTLLGWDQETMMPPRAAEFRAEELALVATLAHDRIIDPRLTESVAACEADPELGAEDARRADLREIRRDIERAAKLPSDLVRELSETSSRALEAWKRARAESDFEAFRPWLERQVGLARRKAACLGAPEGGEGYDALLDEFEPGMRASGVERLFAPLRDALVRLIRSVREAGDGPSKAPCRVAVPVERQRELNRFVAAAVGFDFDAGRLDVSTHPFTEGVAPGDTRITTRYRDDEFLDALGSTLHEVGHGLYEQGLPKDRLAGHPLAEAASLGIHESQSRLWENQVGRSRAFWAWAAPHVRRLLSGAAAGLEADALHAAVNVVEPGPIRVESDEVTYNLHIMLRFDLERAMLRGDLAVADLPGAWNDRVRGDLGLEVADDRRGCLQDIHWSMGAIGYFPTYTLGNLYAAQLWEAARDANPDLEDGIAHGEFAPLLRWLREHVHAHGRRYPAAELCRRITRRALDHAPLVAYLESKVEAFYGPGSGPRSNTARR